MTICLVGSAGAFPGPSCTRAALRGQYTYTAAGIDNDGNAIAETGIDLYKGDGTMTGEYSGSTAGVIVSNSTYTGTYTVSANCSGTLTLNDGSHYDFYMAPSGDSFNWIETDTGYTFQGPETRVSK